jgi:hypothetical protein
MMDKQEMLQKLAAEWDALLEIVGRVPQGAMEAAGVAGEWSVKDLLGHTTAWEEEAIKAFGAGRSGLDLDSYGDTDEWNDRDVIRRRSHSVHATLVELGAVHQRFVSWVEGLPDEAFHDDKLATMLDDESAEHYRDHGDDIERWLAARRG